MTIRMMTGYSNDEIYHFNLDNEVCKGDNHNRQYHFNPFSSEDDYSNWEAGMPEKTKATGYG